MKKRFYLLFAAVLVFSSCGKKAEEVQKEPEISALSSVSEIEEKPQEEEESLEGLAQSPLTGEYIDEEKAVLRPFAVTINNLHKALPQSGIGQADILYEVPAEGEITRIVAVFQYFDAEKIGPVRSARDYFTYFALDNDAVYVHHGGSPTGYAAIKNRGINHIDGMRDNAFWRDKERMNKAGMYEHSSYTDAEGLKKSAEAKGYRDKYEGEPMFSFYDEETVPEGENADFVSIPYSYYQISQFKFNSQTGLYERSQSDMPQIDDITGEQLSVKNVILQEAPIYVISGDEAGRREVSLVGSGKGTLVTMGRKQNITWSKDTYYSPTKWFDEKGNPLELNKGKTWICVCPENCGYTFE